MATRGGGGGGRGMSGGGNRGFSGGGGAGGSRGGGGMPPGGGRPSGGGMPGGGMPPGGGRPPGGGGGGSNMGGFILGMLAGSAMNRQSGGNQTGGAPKGGGGGGNGGGNGGGSPQRNNNNGGGRRNILVPVLIVIIIIVMIVGCVVVVRSGSTGYEGDGITRTKLEADKCTTSSEWIDDELYWISDQSEVISAMEDFYDQTGVQPYLMLTDNIYGEDISLSDADAETYLDELYDSLYSDEGHMIFLFVQGPERYWTWVYTGLSANSVIDSSAQEIIEGIADRYYSDSSLTNDEYFASIFTISADTLMQDYHQQARTRNIVIVILVIGVVLIVALLIAWRLAVAKTKQAEKTKEILDTPIGQSPEAEDLERKYGDHNDGTS